MRPLRWTVNAAMRTWRALSVRRARPDDAFAREWLPPAEYGVYLQMDPRDRDHAVRVARIVRARWPEASDTLIRAALLHDVGKASRPYRVWERIVAHLWAPADIPAEPRFDGIRGAWQLRVHHAAYGAALVRRAGGCEAVARLVEEHDAADPGPDARKLRDVDELR